MDRTYIAIDLKSFYASVECVERGLDPLNINLVVADPTRTSKTICLAVSPALKSFGVAGRPRLFEVEQRVREINASRLSRAPGHAFRGGSFDASQLASHPELSLTYVTAPPRMALYMEYSTKIYDIYLKYVSPEDIHIYSIDEVFIDVTKYLPSCGLTGQAMAKKLMREVFEATGVTATAGVGTNLYLCKIAMDILAKHAPADKDGARIAELDEDGYRRLMWAHQPLTDFWRVGRGYAKKLEEHGMYTMGDVARCSIGPPGSYHSEKLLYKLFGVNAELLIDHAWGWEPCTIADIKGYKPENRSVGSGQVLQCPYDWEKARLVVREMTDMLALDLVDKGLVCGQITLTVGFDAENLTDPSLKAHYSGPVSTDMYGRKIPKHAHGTANLPCMTSSSRVITDAMMELYDRIVPKGLFVRRVTVTANRVVDERTATKESDGPEQLDMFGINESKAVRQEALEREKRMQKAIITLKKKYGKNAVLKGMNLQEGATARSRNRQIGGHKA